MSGDSFTEDWKLSDYIGFAVACLCVVGLWVGVFAFFLIESGLWEKAL